ncbi:NADP-dependent 3-hydroxy acid dehydrogenase YdfG [Paraburkholderia sp. GAS334]
MLLPKAKLRIPLISALLYLHHKRRKNIAVNLTKNGFKRVWFITGASRGLGALIAQAALADGNAVVAAGRNVAAIAERRGDSPALLPVELDVTDEAQAKAAVQAAIEESSDADVRRMYDTNVFGLLNITRAVLPMMRSQRSGHVINMSSIGGYRSSRCVLFDKVRSRRLD